MTDSNKFLEGKIDFNMFQPSDFDGHTEFYRMTPEQKLEWLSAAVEFYFLLHGKPND